jgi:hypothetical protein
MNLQTALASIQSFPEQDQAHVLISYLKQEFEASLYKTCKYLLGYNAMTLHTHADMIKTLESTELKKLITMPRGTFKSSIGVVGYSIWRLMKDPDLRIMIDSEKYENSKNFIREIKGKLAEPLFQAFYGDWSKTDNWAEGSITIAARKIIKKESSITASGVEAGKTGQHFELVIHDDLNTHENSQNSEQRKKIIQHYQMNTSILDPGGELVIIGTRYAMDDVIGFVLENEIWSE